MQKDHFTQEVAMLVFLIIMLIVGLCLIVVGARQDLKERKKTPHYHIVFSFTPSHTTEETEPTDTRDM